VPKNISVAISVDVAAGKVVARGRCSHNQVLLGVGAAYRLKVPIIDALTITVITVTRWIFTIDLSKASA
jgi:hypothetical protein